MNKLYTIKKGFLFQNFTPSELEALAQVVQEKTIQADTYLFKEGSLATAMYIIQKGSVEILKEGAGGTQLVVAQLTAGDHFGEMAFVDRAPRAAGALIKENSCLLEIHYVDLESMVATQPILGLKLYHSIAKTLCQRIRQTTSDLSHLIL